VWVEKVGMWNTGVAGGGPGRAWGMWGSGMVRAAVLVQLQVQIRIRMILRIRFKVVETWKPYSFGIHVTATV
jgi:hypothetical protein